MQAGYNTCICVQKPVSFQAICVYTEATERSGIFVAQDSPMSTYSSPPRDACGLRQRAQSSSLTKVVTRLSPIDLGKELLDDRR